MPQSNSKKGSLVAMIQSPGAVKQFEAALPDHVPSARFVRCVLTAIAKTPKLADCTQASLTNALVQLAQVGLMPDGRYAHLIPYGKSCQLIIDYKGLVELAYQSGFVKSIHADVVREEDEFRVTNGEVHHTVDYRTDRGDVFAVYCCIALTTGGVKSEVMSLAEVEAVRKRSASSGSGPWNTDWAEMAKKTVFKRAAKYIPESPDLHQALITDDASERDAERSSLKQQNDALRDRLAAFDASGDTIDAEATATRHEPSEAAPDQPE